MAEALSLVANLAGVVTAGLALSKILYDFAVILGTASSEVKALATDISLFCSVLKHVQTTLTRARAFRLSLSAIQTAEDVVDRCRIIFKDLEATVIKLQKGVAKLDLITRVKWFFQEKRVLLVHEQLKTCTATLHLMLTTIVLAQKIANKRLSLAAEDDEDAQDRSMTHALLMAQQAANERLAAVEDEVILEESRGETAALHFLDSFVPPEAEGALGGGRLRGRRNRSSQIMNGSIQPPLGPLPLNLEQDRRVSVMIGNHINRLSLTGSVRSARLSKLDEDRLSVLQTDELLRHWTDQSDPLASPEGTIRPAAQHQDQQSESHDSSATPIAGPLEVDDVNHDACDNDGRKSDRSLEGSTGGVGPGEIVLIRTIAGQREIPTRGRIEVLRHFLVGLDDSCYMVLFAVLQRYNLLADWRQYALYIVYGGQERCIGLDEKPLVLYRELDMKDTTPVFTLRKRHFHNAPTWTRPATAFHRAGSQSIS